MTTDGHESSKPEHPLKIALLVTKNGPIVIATSHTSFTDPGLVRKLHSKGIDRFIAYSLPWDLVKQRYGGHFDIALHDLHEQDDLRVLDFDGERAFSLFHLRELGEPVMYEGPEHRRLPASRRQFKPPSHSLSIDPSEIIELVRAQMLDPQEREDFHTSIWKEYIIEEEFDRKAYGIHDGVEHDPYGIREGAEFDLVTALATLTIEPPGGPNYWVLTAVVETPIGPFKRSDEDGLSHTELTLDDFEAELKSPRAKRRTVRLDFETPSGKHHFFEWLKKIRARRSGAHSSNN